MKNDVVGRYGLASVLRAPDEPAAPAAPVAPAPSPTPAPDASSAAPAPAASGTTAAAPSSSTTDAPASSASTNLPSEAATAAKAAPDASAPAAPESTPSLLGAAKPKKPDAKAEAPAADKGDTAAKPAADAQPATADVKKDDAKPAEKPAAEAKPDDKAAPADTALAAKPQARSYEAFKVPDGTKLDDKQVTTFTTLLDDANLSHQERGQKLIDMYVAEAQRIVSEQDKHQRKVWNDFTSQLKADFKADPELGGNREETSLGTAAFVVQQLGGTEAQVNDLLAMMNHTGMGNHVGLVRLLNNFYERYMAEGSPVPGNPPSRRDRRSFQDTMYGE